jgi:hypothetical protein
MAADSGEEAGPAKGFPEVINGDTAYIGAMPQFRTIDREAETAQLFQAVTKTT